MSKLYLVNLTKATIAGVFAEMEDAEKVAKRMRHETYLGDAEDLQKNFKLEELQKIVANISPDEVAPARSKAAVVREIVDICDAMDWEGKVKPNAIKKTSRKSQLKSTWLDSQEHAERKELTAELIQMGEDLGVKANTVRSWVSSWYREVA